MSELESIEEDEMSEKCESGFQDTIKSNGSGQGIIYFDAEIEKELEQSKQNEMMSNQNVSVKALDSKSDIGRRGSIGANFESNNVHE